ncbi:hypothetical protein [Cellulomonas composti]|uniref:Uncharacterized protein n=1 Tax=Cellulomonas composti TaxID=266130 RepID=A0A511JBL8_9CELL|nr:hypothetical protein [Cellulomonas composti]GEL95380.1 hypothetical protein CCO02nite_20380 [Cellulomonas composti]
MSTEIKPWATWAPASIKAYSLNEDGPDVVAINLPNGSALSSRADFLAAVASELDVIVVPRADLPEVRTGGEGDDAYLVAAGVSAYLNADPAETHRKALGFLAIEARQRALASERDAADERAVEALASILDQYPGSAPNAALARALLARRDEVLAALGGGDRG